MQNFRPMTLPRVVALLAGLLILKVTVSVVQGYQDYLPPNFASSFLLERKSYFFGAYGWAFYAHIASGPVSLVLGLALINERLRTRFTRWHRRLGKAQAVLVLCLLTPSGLWLAFHAQTGVVAATGFAVLAVFTGACMACGWRAAVKQRITAHRRWMWRCFVLLCSAVVLRMIGGLATVTGIGGDWTYPLAAWASWLVPLAVFELRDSVQRRYNRRGNLGERHSSSSSAASSWPEMEISARR